MISYLLPQRAATVQSLGHPAAGVIGWVDSEANNTGVSVTQHTALTMAAVWCATRVLSETIATLPCLLYRRKSDDTRERAREDDRYWLMSHSPHPRIAAVSFFESMTAAMVLQGNCYARIARKANQKIVRLDIRQPDTVRPEVQGDEVIYTFADPRETVLSDEVLHVPGLGGDGITGWSVVSYAAQSIGSGIAADQYAGGQWGNGATPAGVLTHPMRLDKAARAHLRREWEEVHKGSVNAGKVAIMHGGMEFKPISMPNRDAQFLESRQFSIREVARWFRLPPHMLADLADSSVRANIEQQAIEFIVYSLKPWLTRWQQTLNRKLLGEEERRVMYFEFLLESLLQGDSAAQASAWSVGRQWGWYSVNDIRRMLNMPPVDGGDVYLQPSNMVPADSEMAAGERPDPPPVMQPPPPNGKPKEEDGDETEEQARKALGCNWVSTMQAIMATGRQQIEEAVRRGVSQYNEVAEECEMAAGERLQALRQERSEIHQDFLRPVVERVRGCDVGLVESANELLRDHLRVVVKRERSDVMKAAHAIARGSELNAWLDEYYARLASDVMKRIEPACTAYRGIRPYCGESLSRDISRGYCTRHQADVMAASRGNRSGSADRVQAAMDAWDEQINSMALGD